jgi:hypothetical protein
MNLTLAAFYGDKPESFVALIRWCQAAVSAKLPGAFRPYDVRQVHATIVGLEGTRTSGQVHHEHYNACGRDPRPMDLRGLVEMVRRTELLPIRARIGGFRREDEYPFESLGAHPYLRTFAIQPSSIVVAMGWPEAAGEFPNSLDLLRRECVRFGILHKYHRTAECKDNDLFFVLGKVDLTATNRAKCDATSEAVRGRFSGIQPVHIEVNATNLSLIAYSDNELPLATSVPISLESAVSRIKEIETLYKEVT